MSVEGDKSLVRRVVEGFLTSADPTMADELLSPGYVDNNPANPGMSGPENIERSVADWHRAFPDTVKEVQGILAQDASAMGTGGRFYGPDLKQRKIPARALRSVQRAGLWAASEDLVRPYLSRTLDGAKGTNR